MLALLKIIWQFHQKVSRFFGPRYIGDDLFLGPNLVSFNRAVVPLFELSFLTKSQKLSSAQKQKFLSVCQKRFNKLKNINISKTSQQNDFYYTRVPGFSGIGHTREDTRLQDHICLRFMLRSSSLVECVSVLHGNRCLQSVEFFFLRQYVQHVC